MVVDDFGDDGEAEAYAFFFGGEEGIENLFAGFGGDAGAGIFDDDGNSRAHVLRFGSYGDAEAAASVHGLIGVGDEVDENLFEELGVHMDVGSCGSVVALDGDLRVGELVLDGFEDAVNEGGELRGAQIEM